MCRRIYLFIHSFCLFTQLTQNLWGRKAADLITHNTKRQAAVTVHTHSHTHTAVFLKANYSKQHKYDCDSLLALLDELIYPLIR
jgi:hypothetical protein